MAIVTEALDPEGVDWVAQYTDAIQIGACSMQNHPVLRRAGRSNIPAAQARMSATIDELLLAAEYILSEGNTRDSV